MWSFPAEQPTGSVFRGLVPARVALLAFSRDAAPFFVDHAHSLGRRCSVGREMHQVRSTNLGGLSRIVAGTPKVRSIQPHDCSSHVDVGGRCASLTLSTTRCGTAPCPGDWQGPPNCGGPLPRRITAPPHTERGAPPAVDLCTSPSTSTYVLEITAHVMRAWASLCDELEDPWVLSVNHASYVSSPPAGGGNSGSVILPFPLHPRSLGA